MVSPSLCQWTQTTCGAQRGHLCEAQTPAHRFEGRFLYFSGRGTGKHQYFTDSNLENLLKNTTDETSCLRTKILYSKVITYTLLRRKMKAQCFDPKSLQSLSKVKVNPHPLTHPPVSSFPVFFSLTVL